MALKSTGEEELDCLSVDENEAPTKITEDEAFVHEIANAAKTQEKALREKEECKATLANLRDTYKTLSREINAKKESLSGKRKWEDLEEDGFVVPQNEKKKMKAERRRDKEALGQLTKQRSQVVKDRDRSKEELELLRSVCKESKRKLDGIFASLSSLSSLRSSSSTDAKLIRAVIESVDIFGLPSATINHLVGPPPKTEEGKNRKSTSMEDILLIQLCDYYKAEMNRNKMVRMIARSDGMGLEESRGWRENSIKTRLNYLCNKEGIEMLNGTANHNTFSYEAAELILDKMDAREDMDDGTLDIGALATELYEEARNVSHLLNGFTQNQLYMKIRNLSGEQTICKEEDCDKNAMIQGRCTQHHNAHLGFEDRNFPIHPLQKAAVATVLDNKEINSSDNVKIAELATAMLKKQDYSGPALTNNAVAEIKRWLERHGELERKPEEERRKNIKEALSLNVSRLWANMTKGMDKED